MIHYLFNRKFYHTTCTSRFYVLCVVSCCLMTVQAQRLTGYIDPYIGSGGHGHVFVGANVPFGAVQVGPSNFYKGWDWCSGYNYQDSVIIGFPQLHLSGTGIGDLGEILIMPYMGDIKLKKGVETERFSGYASQFSHENETVRPGYYAVRLDDFGVEVELTASERVGYHKYKFPKGENARIIIDLTEGINDKSTDTYIELIDQYTIKGYRYSSGWAKRQQVYFAICSSLPITDFAVYNNETLLKDNKGQGESIRGLITFAAAPDEIALKVGISPVSPDNALANIQAEIPHWDFDKIRKQADDLWEKELAKITVESADESVKRIFYTSMYHLMVQPTLFNDHNGDYMGTDWKVYTNPSFVNYTIFSLWDTYRAAHPLFTITNPDRVGDFVNSMLAIFDQTGALPIWHLRGYETGTMVGISSFQVIAEAYLKGCQGFDPERAYLALKTTAMSNLRGLNYIREMKPIPTDVGIGRPVAMGLELANGLASIALMARSLGKMEDYEYFRKRAEHYKLYYDEDTGFFRGKNSKDEWNPVFDPVKSQRPYASDYAEGNAWQYLWLAPHDVEGLIELLGGKEAFLDRFDTFFTLNNDPDDKNILVDLTGNIGQYAHGNEPGHHNIYMYAYAGQQWKTARLARRIMKEFYTDQPDGIIGNEDCGQMSGWYVMSAMGFYPVFTASGEYVIGSPAVDKATINLENGKQFTIEAIDNSPENIYIQSIILNGKEHPYPFITHQDIMNGGTMKLQMSPDPEQRQNEYMTAPFRHPCMAQSIEDLEYMREMIQKGEEPWKTAYQNLQERASLDFVVNPVAYISVGAYGANSIGGREYSQGGTNAYNHALMWYITKDRRYAEKAIEILDAWAVTLRGFDGNNAKLNVALTGSEYMNAAEIIRHTGAGWSNEGIEQFKRSILTVFYPTVADFFTEANGNWDGGIINTMMCMGVFLDDHAMFNRAVERYYRGERNSGILKYVYPGGQCQETTRDWGHVQLGIGEFAKAAQVAATNGIDFYSIGNDRLAQGFEQCAKYMIDKQDIDMYGVMQHRANNSIRDIYETIYSFYKNVRGIDLVYSGEASKAARSRSTVGVLTAIKAPIRDQKLLSKFTNTPLSDPKEPSTNPTKEPVPFVFPAFLKASQTGARIDGPTRPAPEGSIIVQPGESIQAAIDANKGDGGLQKWIVLAAGVHELDGPLVMYSGITLAGEGRATILHLSRGVNTETIVNGESFMENVTIRDMIIEGATNTVENNDPNADRRNRMYMSAPSREGIVFRSGRGGTMKDITFENLTVQNFTKNGIFIADGENVIINRCDASDNGGNVVPGEKFHHNLFLSYSKNTKLTNSRFDTSPWGYGVFVKCCDGVEITGCEAARNKLSGIRCTESLNLTVSDNLIEGNEQNGLTIDAMMDGCRNVTVENNLAQGNTGCGIYIDKTTSLFTRNNVTKHNNKN